MITGAQGCTANHEATIDKPQKPAIEVLSVKDETCPGNHDGSVSFQICGKDGLYSATLLDADGEAVYGGQFTDLSGDCLTTLAPTVSNLAPGDYTLKARGANGCTAEQLIHVGSPTLPEVTIETKSESCTGLDDGSVSFQISGEDGPYTTTICDADGQPVGDAQTTSGEGSIEEVPVEYDELYSQLYPSNQDVVEVTPAFFPGPGVSINAFSPGSAFIELNLLPGASRVVCQWFPSDYIAPDALLDGKQLSIDGSFDYYSAEFTLDPAVPHQVKFDLSNWIGYIYIQAWKQANVAGDPLTQSDLAPGDYTLKTTYGNGCSFSVPFTIDPAEPIEVTATAPPIACHDRTTTVTVSASGGAGIFTSGTGDFLNVGPGEHSYTVTDDNGCAATAEISIENPEPIVATATVTPGSCGSNMWTVVVTATGGHGQLSGTGEFIKTEPGKFEFTVEDDLGCTGTAIAQLDVPPPLAVEFSVKDVSCFGMMNGEIKLSITGGTPFTDDLDDDYYQIQWGGDASASGTGPFLGDLGPGTYTVSVTDAAGCEATIDTESPGDEGIVVEEPTNIFVEIDETVINCHGCCSQVMVSNVSGGVPPYTYEENIGCLPANPLDDDGQPVPYQITVTDDSGCTIVTDIYVEEPSMLQISAEASAPCSSGPSTVTVAATGGQAPYLFTDVESKETNETGVFLGLGTGERHFVVTDDNGCQASTTAVLSAGPQVTATSMPAACFGAANGSITVSALSATATSKNVLCYGENNGSVSVSASGGSGSYFYKIGGGSYQPSNVFTGLGLGTYVVVVKDGNGCTAAASASVGQPNELKLTATPADAGCGGANNGQITATATGGTSDYSFSLNGGAEQTTGLFTGLAAGSYTVSVKDQNGCSKSLTTVVGQSAGGPLSIVIDQVLPVTCPTPNGGIMATVTGCGPFTYMWKKTSNGAVVGTSEDLSNVPAGSYFLVVTDGAGATAQSTNLPVGAVSSKISGLKLKELTSCGAVLTWQATPGATGYEVRYKTCAATSWTTLVAGTATSLAIPDLVKSTCYNFCVRFKTTACDGDWTCLASNLTTPALSPPSNIVVSNITKTTAKVTWAQPPCGPSTPVKVERRYKKVGSTVTNTKPFGGTPLPTTENLTSLSPGTCYVLSMRYSYMVNGVETWSAPSLNDTFCTPLNVLGGDGTALVGQQGGPEASATERGEQAAEPDFAEGSPLEFDLVPNPADERVSIRLLRFAPGGSGLTVRLMSISGRLISQKSLPAAPDDGSAVQLEIGDLPPGVYLVEVANGPVRKVEKLVKI